MLQNAYFLAKIGADTAENEQHFAEILPKIGNYPTGPSGSPPSRGRPNNPNPNITRPPQSQVPHAVVDLRLEHVAPVPGGRDALLDLYGRKLHGPEGRPLRAEPLHLGN